MSCVNSTSFVVLINESLVDFFMGSRDIRQGCPLSPYLFLLIIEGLRRLLIKAKFADLIKGVKIFGSIYLTLTLFVDDVMIFGNGCLDEWSHIKVLLEIFCRSFGMCFSLTKSCFRHGGRRIIF